MIRFLTFLFTFLLFFQSITDARATLHDREEKRGKRHYKLDDTVEHAGSTITAGNDVNIAAGNDVAVLGSIVTAAGDANIQAGDNLTIASVQDTEQHIQQYSKKRTFSSKSSTTETQSITHSSSGIIAGGDVNAVAGQDVNVLASTIQAGNDANLDAGNNINVASGNNYDYSHTETKKKGLSFGFSGGQFNYARMSQRENTSGVQSNVASEITAGHNVNATANRDITVLGSNISAENDITLDAANDVHIAASDSASFNKSSSMKGTYGIGVIANENELGVKQSVQFSKDMSEGAVHSGTASNISAGNDVTITTGRDTNLLASNLAAGHDVNLNTGRDLNILSQGDTAENKQKHLEAEIGVKASVSQNITSALRSIGEIFTVNPFEMVKGTGNFLTNGFDLDGNREGVEDAAKTFNAYNSAVAGGGVDGGVYVYGQVAGSKSSTHSETQVLSNVIATTNINIASANDTIIKGANIKAGNTLNMGVAGDLDVESVQNTSGTTAQQFAANIQSNLLKSGQLSGGMNVSTTEAGRAWVDDQTELTGGKAVNINVGGDMHNKGAVIANVDANGVDKGNLDINVGGELTHEDIQDHDNSVTRGIGVSIGVNPSQDTGGISGVSGTYNDQKKEGVTRATIGEGTITVGGTESDGGGINRDVSKAQEVTFDEGMDVTVNLPIEFIKDPIGYVEKSPGEIRKLPAKIANEVAKVYAVTASAYHAFFPDGLTESQQREFGQAMATRDPEKVNEIVEKFRGKGLSKEDMTLVEAYASGKINVKDFVDSLSPEGQKEAVYRVLVAHDGTWNDAIRDEKDYKETNVFRMTDFYKGNDVVYVDGVGTGSMLDQYLCGFTGCGSVDRRKETIDKLRNSYQQDGNDRFLIVDNVAFSRGSPNNLQFVHEFLQNGLPGLVTPEMVGVYSQILYDPVASFGLPGNGIDLGYDLTTSPKVGVIITTQAMDESRALFPYISSGYADGTSPSNVIRLQFPGAHSDGVGGYGINEGGRSNDLSKVILNEVVSVAVANGVPFGVIPDKYQPAPKTVQAYNNYVSTKAAYNANPSNKNTEAAYKDAYGNLYNNYIHDSRMWFDFDNKRTSYYPNDALRNLPQNQF